MQFVARQIPVLMACFVCAFTFTSLSHAHELQPSYLELRLIEQDLYAAMWKIPVASGRPMSIKAVLPKNCDQRTSEDLRWTVRHMSHDGEQDVSVVLKVD